MQGKTISGYTLQHLLGKGGMAEVWYAENSIEKPAAVKILREDLAHNPDIVERFRNEAKVMVKLSHANIRQVYDYAELDGRPAIIMEYLDGDDLKAKMKKGERFGEQQLEKWWNQMIDALNYTHGEGVVHRDIKPSNIFLDRKGNVHLLDFGIAKIKEAASVTKTGSTMGTLIYMSPEQIKDPKRVDYRSDVYSLAVTFVHLLSGKAPYDSTNSSDYMIQNAIVEKPLDLTALPTAWRSFLEPYLSKEREQRPALKPFCSTATPTSGFTPSVDEDTVIDACKMRGCEMPDKSGGGPVGGTKDGRKSASETQDQVQQKSEQPKKVQWPFILLACLVVAALAAAAFYFFGESKNIDDTDYAAENHSSTSLYDAQENEMKQIAFEISSGKVGPFAVGDIFPDEGSAHETNLQVKQVKETYWGEGEQYLSTEDVIISNGEEIMRLIKDENTGLIGEIHVVSPIARTKEGIGVGSTIDEFYKQYNGRNDVTLWYTYISGMIVMDCKQYPACEFFLSESDYKFETIPFDSDMTILNPSDFKTGAKITSVRLWRNTEQGTGVDSNTSNETWENKTKYVVIDGSELRLRLGPSTGSETFKWGDGSNRHPVVGEKFKYLGESGDFYKIDFKGHELWVAKSFTHLE